MNIAEIREILEANLSGANLSDANLSCVRLNYAIGNMREVMSAQLEKYSVTWASGSLHIGCQSHTVAEWEAFSDAEIRDMDHGALKWWRKWKGPLLTLVKPSFS